MQKVLIPVGTVFFMDIKRVVTLVVFGLFLAAGFMVYFLVYLHTPITSHTINNGKDGHGCLTRSGYRWDNSTQSCIKESSNGTIIYQVFDYDSCFDAGYPVNENNKTHLLQCLALNGTYFINNSTKANLNASSSDENTTNYPDNTTIVGNFSIIDLLGTKNK